MSNEVIFTSTTTPALRDYDATKAEMRVSKGILRINCSYKIIDASARVLTFVFIPKSFLPSLHERLSLGEIHARQ